MISHFGLLGRCSRLLILSQLRNPVGGDDPIAQYDSSHGIVPNQIPEVQPDEDSNSFAPKSIIDRGRFPYFPVNDPVQNLGTSAVADVDSSFQTGESYFYEVPPAPYRNMLGLEPNTTPNAFQWIRVYDSTSRRDAIPCGSGPQYTPFVDTGSPAPPSNGVWVPLPAWERSHNRYTNADTFSFRHEVVLGQTEPKFTSHECDHTWRSSRLDYAWSFGNNCDAATLHLPAFQESHSRDCFTGHAIMAPELVDYGRLATTTARYQDLLPSSPQTIVRATPASMDMSDEDLGMLIQLSFGAENVHWPD